VEFTFDGEDMGVLGKAGKVLRVRFPASAPDPETPPAIIPESIVAPKPAILPVPITEPAAIKDEAAQGESAVDDGELSEGESEEETIEKPANGLDEELL
jgi:hypothetical protein